MVNCHALKDISATLTAIALKTRGRADNMRTVLTITCIVIYMLSYSLYLVSLGCYADIISRLWVNGTWLFIFSFLFIDFCCEFTSNWHKQFWKIGMLIPIINFSLIILYYIWPNASNLFRLCAFNLTALLITCCILFSGIKHKLFNP
jgi:hypothetical protein